MSDEIKVSLELNATKATHGLARFNEGLLTTDRWFKKVIKSQAEVTAAFSAGFAQSRQDLGSWFKAQQNYLSQKQKALDTAKREEEQLARVARQLNEINSAMSRGSKGQFKLIDPTQVAALKELQTIAKLNSYGKSIDNDRVALQSLIRLQQEYQRSAVANKVNYQPTTVVDGTQVAAVNQLYSVYRKYSAERSAADSLAKQKLTEQLGLQKQQLGLVGAIGTKIKEVYSVSAIKDAFSKVAIPSLFEQGTSIINAAKHMANVASEMLGYRNSLQLALGSQKAANTEMQNAIGLARSLKLDVNVLIREYSKFTNSLSLAGVGIDKARRIFEQFAGAARVLNLSPERTSGMFLALEQMVSKGTVSMEELRRQLGDHLPGALNLAAKAMGYGQNELKKFMDEVKRGNVDSKELVEKLGELVYLRTKDLVPQSLQKFSANVQALNTEFTIFKGIIGEITAGLLNPIYEWMSSILRWVNEVIGPMNLLGEKVKYVSLYANETSSSITALGDAYKNVTGSVQALADAQEDVSNTFESFKSGDGLPIASMLLLGSTTVGVTGIVANLGAKLYSFAKDGLGAVRSGLVTTAEKFIRFGNSLKTSIASFSGLSIAGKTGIAGLVTALGVGFGYAIGSFISNLREANTSIRTTEYKLKDLKVAVDNIKNNSITADDLISASATTITLRKIANLQAALNSMVAERDKLALAIRKGNDPQGFFESDDSYRDRTHGVVLQWTEFNNQIKIARVQLDSLGKELDNTVGSLDTAGTELKDKLFEPFGKFLEKIVTKSPLDKLKDELYGLVAEMPDTIQDPFGAPGQMINNKDKETAREYVELLIAGATEQAAWNEERKNSKNLKNIYDEEKDSLNKLINAQQFNIATMTQTNLQKEKAKQQLEHLNRTRELELKHIEGKLSLNEYSHLTQMSAAVRDLAVQYAVLNDEQARNNAISERVNDDIKRANDYIKSLDPGAQIRASIRDIEELKARYAETAPAMVDALSEAEAKLHEELFDVLQKHREANDAIYRIWMDIGDVFADSFAQGAIEGKKFKDILTDIGKQLATMAVRNYFQNSFLPSAMNMVSGSSGSSLLSGIGKFFGGFFADGGDPPLNKFSVVGERGPELIYPTRPTTVMPMSGSSGQAVTISIGNIDASGSKNSMETEQAVYKAVRLAVSESVSTIRNLKARGALPEFA